MVVSACLVDTNVLLRMTRASDPEHKLVDTALARLAGSGTIFCYTHQNIAELWNVLTRPIGRNGFGLSIDESDREIHAVEAGMTLLSESDATYHEWRRIIVQYGVLGVQVHDARLASVMYVHGIDHILTLNVTDFSRFKGLVALHPRELQS